MRANVAFGLVAVLFMYLGRRIGWALSKALFYTAPTTLALLSLISWGIAVGLSINRVVVWFHPNAILRWVFGFWLAAYVSIPNYGLYRKSTIPVSSQYRHTMVFWLPFAAYVVTEFVASFA